MVLLFLKALDILIMILIGLIIFSAVLSWFPMHSAGKVSRTLLSIINPILQPIRRMVQKSIFGGSNIAIDISPFIAYLVLSTLHRSLNDYISSAWAIL